MRSPNRRHDRAHFFKYVTAATGLAVIDTRRRRWSSPLLFNDPFDVPRQASFGFTDDELISAIGAEFVRVVNSGEEPEEAAVRELVLRLRDADDPKLTAFIASTLGHPSGPFAPVLRKSTEEFRKAWEATVPDLRIFCVSEIPDSVAMWAHYAQNHTGFVLQFRSSDELDSSLLLACPVIYQSEPPSLPTLQLWARFSSVTATIDWQAVFHEYYHVKSPEWSYEKEWRVLSFSPEAEPSHFSDTPYHPGELEAVFIGSATAARDIASVEALLASSDFAHVAVWRARHDLAKRRILFDRFR